MKPVTTYPGREIYPTLSPDGGQMVFSGRVMESGNVDLYQRSVLDGSPIRLTTDPGNDIAAAWAPNGSEVAYVSFRAGEPCRIMLLAVPSGDPRMVHRCKGAEITTLSWMPDSRSLVYSDGPDAAAAMNLHRVNLDDGTVEALTASPPRTWGDSKPAVSPDGRTVAFIRSYAWGVSDIVLLDLETRRETRLTEEGQRVSGLAWAWDSQGLFFSSSRTGDLGLWWISAGGGEPRRLSLGLKDVAGLTAARSVDRLAFESMSFRANLYEVDLAGEPGRMKALAPSTAIDGDVDVSPTDGTVAFVSTRTGAPELWLLDSGGEPRRLTQMGGSMLQAPRWSPDGRSIVFATGTKGNFDLYRIGREGGAPVRLTDDPSEDMQAFWSPDGASIYFTSRRSGAWRIWRMDAADPSKQESVTGDMVSAARLSPDGRTLYYVKTHAQGIWRRALAADAPEELLVPDHSAVDWPNFLPTADSIYYVTRPGTGRTVLKIFDLATGQSRQLAEMTDFNAMSGIALRPDGRSLVISRLIQNEIDLQMMDLVRQK
jgi:Tol biopolymer transport system component